MNGQVRLVPTIAEPVAVNVYDVHWSSRFSSWMGLGIYHSGVVVYGYEFSYGRHSDGYSGIYKTKPRAHHDELVKIMRFRSTIALGTTSLTKVQVFGILRAMDGKWPGKDYNLLRNNCNDFANDFTMMLCEVGLPKWVNRLARYTGPFIELIAPKHWFQFQEGSSPIISTPASPPRKPKVETGVDARELLTAAEKPAQLKKSCVVNLNCDQTSGDSSFDDSKAEKCDHSQDKKVASLLAAFLKIETRSKGRGIGKRLEQKRASSEFAERRHCRSECRSVIRCSSVGSPRERLVQQPKGSIESSSVDSDSVSSSISSNVDPESKPKSRGQGQLSKSKSRAFLLRQRKSRRRQQHPKPRAASKSKPRKRTENEIDAAAKLSVGQKPDISG